MTSPKLDYLASIVPNPQQQPTRQQHQHNTAGIYKKKNATTRCHQAAIVAMSAVTPHTKPVTNHVYSNEPSQTFAINHTTTSERRARERIGGIIYIYCERASQYGCCMIAVYRTVVHICILLTWTWVVPGLQRRAQA